MSKHEKKLGVLPSSTVDDPALKQAHEWKGMKICKEKATQLSIVHSE